MLGYGVFVSLDPFDFGDALRALDGDGVAAFEVRCGGGRAGRPGGG